MTTEQIKRLQDLRKSIAHDEMCLRSEYAKLREFAKLCDHRYGNRRSALKRTSTHDTATCGGYHECAVCAGEQPETFVNVCKICKKQETPCQSN